MPKSKSGRATAKACTKCGAPTEGTSTLCLACFSNVPTVIDSDTRRRVIDGVKKRIAAEAPAGPVCPHCRASLDWSNIACLEIELTIYVREKMYYCPSCRAFLGASSWHTEG